MHNFIELTESVVCWYRSRLKRCTFIQDERSRSTMWHSNLWVFFPRTGSTSSTSSQQWVEIASDIRLGRDGKTVERTEDRPVQQHHGFLQALKVKLVQFSAQVTSTNDFHGTPGPKERLLLTKLRIFITLWNNGRFQVGADETSTTSALLARKAFRANNKLGEDYKSGCTN